MSRRACHLLNPENKGMMAKILFERPSQCVPPWDFLENECRPSDMQTKKE
jgi:hypothetical protein